MAEASEALDQLRRPSTVGAPMRSNFNKIAEALAKSWCFLTGHRAALNSASQRRLIVRIADLDLLAGVVLLSDKRVPIRENRRRLVPLPGPLCDLLTAYFEAVEIVIGKLPHKRTRHAVERRLQANFPQGFVFELAESGSPKQLGLKSLRETFATLGIDPNSGRHWFQYALRRKDSHISGPDILLLSGRGGDMQQTLSQFSLVDLETLIQRSRKSLNELLTSLDVCFPRRGNLPISSNHISRKHQTIRRRAYEPDWKCPVIENHLLFVRLRNQVLDDWRKRPSPDHRANLCLSLILIDGIACFEEFIGVLAKLASMALAANQAINFVDCVLEELGLRRTYLSPLTNHFMERLRFQHVDTTVKAMIKALESELVVLARGFGETNLALLLTAQAAWTRQHLPLLLAHFATGHLYGRVPLAKDAQGVVVDDLAAAARLSPHRVSSSLCPSDVASDLSELSKLLADLDRQSLSTAAVSKLAVSRLEKLAMHSVVGAVSKRFAEHLFEKGLAVSTVQSYLSVIKEELVHHQSELEAEDDLFDWGLADSLAAKIEAVSRFPEGTRSVVCAAVDHFSELFNLEVRSQGRRITTASKKYVLIPSEESLVRTHGLLDELCLGKQTRLKLKAVSAIFVTSPLRRDELAYLKTSHFSKDAAVCIVEPGLRGRLKSISSHRWFCPRDVHSQLNSTALAVLLQDLSSSSIPTTILGNGPVHDPGTAHALIDKYVGLLRHESDEPGVRFHVGRHRHATQRLEEFVLPGQARKSKDSLFLRNLAVEVAADLGHANEATTINHYLVGLSWWRWTWMAGSRSSVEFSDHFVASALSRPIGTVRSAKSRLRLSSNDLLFAGHGNNSSNAQERQTGKSPEGPRPDTNQVPQISRGLSWKEPRSEYVTYLAYRFTGSSTNRSEFEADIDPISASILEQALSTLVQLVASKEPVTKHKSPEKILGHLSSVFRVATALSQIAIPVTSLGLICKAIRNLNTPLQVDSDWLGWFQPVLDSLGTCGIQTRIQTSSENTYLALRKAYARTETISIRLVSASKVANKRLRVRFSRCRHDSRAHSSEVSITTSISILAILISFTLRLMDHEK